MRISVRWVLSQKVKNGENITKARLCARGFEEVKDFPNDSPCCSRTGTHTIFILITSNLWEIKSVDVKINLITSPKGSKHIEQLEIAKMCLHVREELVSLGAKLSSIGPGIFYWQDDSGLIGILACHMDNMIWGGTEYFETNVIDSLKSTFKFGSEETETLVYTGIELTQNSDYSICIEQNNYIASISEI